MESHPERMKRMIMKKTIWAAFTLGLATTVACGDEVGGGDDEIQPTRTEPLVVTDSPRCLNQIPFPIAGQTTPYFQALRNLGAETLTVSEARIVDELRPGAITVDGIADPENNPCTSQSPCGVGFRENAFMRFELTPPSAGWDFALVEVVTNDPDYAAEPFRFAIVSAAESAPQADDFGERPEKVRCVCRLDEEGQLPEECRNN